MEAYTLSKRNRPPERVCWGSYEWGRGGKETWSGHKRKGEGSRSKVRWELAAAAKEAECGHPGRPRPRQGRAWCAEGQCQVRILQSSLRPKPGSSLNSFLSLPAAVSEVVMSSRFIFSGSKVDPVLGSFHGGLTSLGFLQ